MIGDVLGVIVAFLAVVLLLSTVVTALVQSVQSSIYNQVTMTTGRYGTTGREAVTYFFLRISLSM